MDANNDRAPDALSQGSSKCGGKQEYDTRDPGAHDDLVEHRRGKHQHSHHAYSHNRHQDCYTQGRDGCRVGRGGSWRKITTTTNDTSKSSFMEQTSKRGNDKEGSVDTVQAIENSGIEDCGNDYYKRMEMVMEASGSGTQAMTHGDHLSGFEHQQQKKRSLPMDTNSERQRQSLGQHYGTRRKKSYKRHRKTEQSQSKQGEIKGVSPGAAW